MPEKRHGVPVILNALVPDPRIGIEDRRKESLKEWVNEEYNGKALELWRLGRAATPEQSRQMYYNSQQPDVS